MVEAKRFEGVFICKKVCWFQKKIKLLKNRLVHKVATYTADYSWVELNHLTAFGFQYLNSSSVCITMVFLVYITMT